MAEIRTRIMEARNRGTAVLLISADLDEIFALSDRIVVMSEGRAVHETPIAERRPGRHRPPHGRPRLNADGLRRPVWAGINNVVIWPAAR